MAVNDLYRSEWKGKRNLRWRVDIMVRSTSVMPGSPTVITLPFGAISLQAPSASKYPDSIGLGRLVQGEYKAVVKLWKIAGSTALDYLRPLITDYMTASAGVVPGYTGEGGTFDLANIWRIYCDGGTAGASWHLMFEGVQAVDASPKFTAHLGRGLSLEVTLKPIADAVMTAASMLPIMDRVAAYTPTEKYDVYDSVWSGAGHTYDIRSSGFKCRFWQMVHLWTEINRLCDDIYCIMTRQTPENATGTWHWRIRSVNSPREGMPLDHWTMYEQDPATAGSTGPELAREDLLLLGEFEEFLGGVTLGGLLYGGKDSLAVFDSLAAYFKDEVEAGAIRIVVQQTSAGEMDILLVPVVADASVTNSLWPATTLLPISRTDLRMSVGSSEVKGVMSDHLIRSVDVSIRGAQQGDRKTQKSEGSNDNGQSIALAHDNLPIVGNKDEFSYTQQSGLTIGASMQRLYLWKPYYFGLKAYSAEVVPIRVHSTVRCQYDGVTAEVTGTGWSLPTTGDDEGDFGNMVDDYREKAAAVQKTDGTGGALMHRLPQKLGDRRQSTYEVTVPIVMPGGRIIDQYHTGLFAHLPIDGSGDYTANGLINNGDDSADMFALGPIISVLPNHVTGNATLTIMGVKS